MSNKKTSVNTSNTKQLQYWQGIFGDQYIERNSNISYFQKRKPFFRQILQQFSDIHSILEIGCSIGANLLVLHKINPNIKLFGVEPNKKAIKIAHTLIPFAKIQHGNSLIMKFTQKFDLVFTAGVLIHIADKDLTKTLANMYAMSKRYVLSIEYFAPKTQKVTYRGVPDVLFKRPFGEIWQKQYPQLILKGSGFLSKENGFDDCQWWLFKKE